ncbi:MAG TPA: serine/threonine-protein kinase [Vicinamibacteria bacterium]
MTASEDLPAMICPSCKAENDATAEACFTCGRALGALTHGAIIGNRYEILSPLGKGGMGMVYKAHDRMLDETVALKVLRSEFANTPEMAKRFMSEIKLARKVSHRNVCRIHEYGEDNGIRYISMEFVEGTDLKQTLRDRGGLPADEAFEVAIQVADGLQAIHDVGIIHRDLKTPNIMRDQRGVVRLMDFGIAKIEGMDRASGALTTTGQIMGTPEYMSPEQCLGEKIDHRSDIYALGIVDYEIFTGQVPFRGDTPVATLFKHLQDPVPFEAGPGATRIPLHAVPVLRCALAKNRAERFSTAAELAQAMREARQRFKSGGPAEAGPPGVAAAAPAQEPTGEERRRETRLDIFVNFILRRVGTLGTVLQEERTIAENVGRGGARVMTTMSSLVPGDHVQLEEVGGPFKTKAEVRGAYVGKDNIRRINLKFLDGHAPSHLVRVEESTPTTPTGTRAPRSSRSGH